MYCFEFKFHENVKCTVVYYIFQVINQDQVYSDDRIDSEDREVSFPNRTFEQNGTSSNSSNNYEVDQLKLINLQLYQHAVKRILQNGSQ